jgi:CheY-like chemotaxis protein
LIIDDEILIVKTTAILLRHLGYRTLEAFNGEGGITLAKSESPDLILLDLVMPGEDGWEVLGELKSDRITAGIPVIIFTAKHFAHPETVMDVRGADGYISKPFPPEELQILIARLALKDTGPA